MLNFSNYDNWLSDDRAQDEDEETNEFDEYDEADYRYEQWRDSQYE